MTRQIHKLALPQTASLVSWADGKPLAAITCGVLIGALLPRRWDLSLLAFRTRLSQTLRLRSIERWVEVLRNLAGKDVQHLADNHLRTAKEVGWHRIRSILHSARSNYEIQLDGLEHLQQALSEGHGAILWSMFFCGFTIPKEALWRAGIRVSHLSRQDHAAPSRSWLGLRVIAPLFWRAETPFLAKRVVMPLDGSLGYMRELMGLLENNQCISIFGELPAKRQNQGALFFGRMRNYATGAPALAARTGAALLTVYTVREGPLRYRVVIEPPITVDRTANQSTFVQAAIEEFSTRIERQVMDHPTDWDGWADFSN